MLAHERCLTSHVRWQVAICPAKNIPNGRCSAELRWHNIHQLSEGGDIAGWSRIGNSAAKEAGWDARRLSSPNIELTIANHQRVGWRNSIGRQEMQDRIRRGLTRKNVIRRDDVCEQGAEIMRVEQYMERCAAAVRHNMIVDTRVGKLLAEIAHARKGWLVGWPNVLIGCGKGRVKLIVRKCEILGQRADTPLKRDTREIDNPRERRRRAKVRKCGIDRQRNRWVRIADSSVKIPNNSTQHGRHFRCK
jgi:hypothetical protein